MNKTAFKVFLYISLISAFIATLLLAINFIGFAIIGSDQTMHIRGKSPIGMLDKTAESITRTEDGFYLEDSGIISSECWCILINESGEIIWSQNKPDDIPDHYSINDVARMTRWFLNDYPVYVRTEDYGMFVLGTPKNSVGKYDMEYSMEWFSTLPKRMLAILAVNLCFAVMLAFLLGINMYLRIRILTRGITDLRCEKCVNIKVSGIFKEISQSINDTSELLNRKNAALAQRERARENWISGISHDIRTPLSIIVGNSEALSESESITEEERSKARIITAQSVKIKKLIEDLNLISSLEYDMQPSKKTDVHVCPLLRELIADVINSGLSYGFEIELDIRAETAVVSADKDLLERALFNLINNSITHNEKGCIITIRQYMQTGIVHIIISDNGIGVPDEIIKNIGEIPKSAHGLGLPMAYRIVHACGGKLTAANDNGFRVEIEMPCAM